MKRILTLLGVAVVGIAIGLIVGRRLKEGESVVSAESRVEIERDTIVQYLPAAVAEEKKGRHRYRVSVKASERVSAINDGAKDEPGVRGDSVEIELPVVQRHYSDSTYEAWVSGPMEPRLDSIKVYRKTRTIEREVEKPSKRWHLGLTAGYGYGVKGWQPYIGVGITYSIISF